MFEEIYKTPRKSQRSPQITKSSEFPAIISAKFFKNPNYKSKKWSLPEQNPENLNKLQRNWVLESPFCRLLNESEREPFEKYQVLGKLSEKVRENTQHLLKFYQSRLFLKEKHVVLKSFSKGSTQEVMKSQNYLYFFVEF